MTEDRQNDMELRLRKNRGHRLVADWSLSLSRACGVEISATSFLSIERTEDLRRAYFNKIRTISDKAKLFWGTQERDRLVAHLLDVCVDVRTTAVILFSSVDRFVGAVRVPADTVLRNAIAVWDIVNEDLCVTTDDLQHGLCLEENFYYPAGEYVSGGLYELTVWGLFAKECGEEGSGLMDLSGCGQ
ncbi:MAG: hypothetical protein NT069_20500 [Planctomycetota bacterium]|nr:hypothetical protein [Planctomycetota bacterium]